ncbi:MAG: hypothetical protein QF886_23495, partial [Planctomycetota bacterium]|nr:hypothetical protein [Planctomycetota bacterium]
VFDTHLVIRDLSGKLLHEFKDIENTQEPKARLEWVADSPGPAVYAKGEKWTFDSKLKLQSTTVHEDGLGLAGGLRLLS